MASLLEYKDLIVELGLTYVPKVLLSLFTLVTGLWLISQARNMLGRLMAARGVDATLAPFIGSLLGWFLKVVLFISAASMVGIQTTSLVAVLGAAGLAVGLALQGSLSNFAGGVLLLLFRPYKVGDLVEAQGTLGVVQELQIFTTTLLTPGNLTVVVPNGPMSNGTITNYTVAGKMRVDLSIGISYGSNIEQAREVLLAEIAAIPGVLSEPAPLVAVQGLDDSAVNLAVRPYCKPDNYWDVYFTSLERCKLALDKAGITIPFPQRDVHLHQLPTR